MEVVKTRGRGDGKENTNKNSSKQGKPDSTRPERVEGRDSDGLANMTMSDREEFIRTLEAEMRRISLNVRAYLIPLGIPGRTPEDLTPSEVGHLVRYLKLTVPQAMPAVERAMARYSVFSGKGEPGARLAA